MCQDLNKDSARDSECKVTRGGVGSKHITIKITSKAYKGYDYDIKIYGIRRD